MHHHHAAAAASAAAVGGGDGGGGDDQATPQVVRFRVQRVEWRLVHHSANLRHKHTRSVSIAENRNREEGK